ncbi:MAG: glycosyltransferase family 2 protein [Candidatus Curtissbacteria bacterium]|nr:glycosyltransferase family 2 protein [Candidatus Curtissbacteria bacterium]
MVPKTCDFSLILACYNEGPTFEDNVGKIVGELKKLKGTWEVIFVEDKSSDSTLETLERICRQIKNSKLILHKINEGRGKSVRDGILVADGEICGFIDVDCEISPSYVPIFIEEIKKGNDVAIATRFYENQPHAIARTVSSKAYSFVVSMLLKAPFTDTEAGFKFFRKAKILPIIAKSRDDGWFFDTEICMLAHFGGLKISQVPVLFIRREDKKSTVRLIPDSANYFRKLLAFRGKYKDMINKLND